MSTPVSRLYSFADDRNNGIPITATRVDAELNQDITALNQKVVIQATAPLSPIAGMLWLDSANKLLKQYRNSEWVVMGIVHVSATQPATSQTGDLWVDTGNNLIKLYTGAAYVTVGFNVLTPPAIGTTTPAAAKFTTLEATTTLKLATTNQGDILYDNGTSIVRLTPGTAGTALISNGAGANPSYGFPSGMLGTWDYSTYSADVVYQASTDGFVLVVCTIQGSAVKSASILTDAANPPTHSACQASSTSSTTAFTFTLMCPVKKGHYWKASNVAGTSISQIYWIPLGS